VLTPDQVQQILEQQTKWQLPFGAIATRIFGIGDRIIWRARALQVAPLLPVVDLRKEERSKHARTIILRDEAVYYGILPLRTDQGELICATSRETLPETMTYLCSTLRIPTCFVLADPGQLQDEVLRTYGLGIDDLESRLADPQNPGKKKGPRAAVPNPDEVLEKFVFQGTEADQPRRLSPDHLLPPSPQPRNDDPTPFIAPLVASMGMSAADLLRRPTRVRFSCPDCRELIDVPSTYCGKRVRCPHCKGVAVVPEAKAPGSSAA